MTELVVVANRLPVHRVGGRGPWERSPGGLTAALHPVLQQRGGLWIGWPGSRTPATLPDDLGYRLVAVDLAADEVRDYYDGFSNATLWPLYHDQIRAPIYRHDWWNTYRRVNERFAEAIAAYAGREATVWIHDYHLQLVPRLLRDLRPDLRIGFFLHIPFPPASLFARLPWRDEILHGIAGADVIGLQTERDVEHFTRSADRLAMTPGSQRRHSLQNQYVGAFPIAVDTGYWNDLAHRTDVQARTHELRERFGHPQTVLLGIDRLDYTKGIEQRLRAFGHLLDSGQLRAPDAVMVQVASPSRDRTSAYRTERSRIEELVGRINGQHAHLGAAAVHYVHRSIDPPEVAALYRATNVMLVTPYHDGMNLVAKEFVASRIANRGVLVLSEFAGAAAELTDALTVNPHDAGALSQAILEAINMPEVEIERRMKNLRKTVTAHTVHDWAASFLAHLDGNQ